MSESRPPVAKKKVFSIPGGVSYDLDTSVFSPSGKRYILKAPTPLATVAPTTQPTVTAAPRVSFVDDGTVPQAPRVSFAVAGGGGAEPQPVAVEIEQEPVEPTTIDNIATIPVLEDAFKKRVKRVVDKIVPVSAGIEPVLDMVSFSKFGQSTTQKETIGKKPVLDIKPEKDMYAPLGGRWFNNFIVQEFQQYSPFFSVYNKLTSEDERVTYLAGLKSKELNQNACKERDPNRVETFYYQKFVRDYLNAGTPYRGLLVYHGLGSGKTCTSVAAAEALYWGGKKVIYILTPATLSNNYRRELGKCGYFPLRQNNYWEFMKINQRVLTQQKAWVVNTMGLPLEVFEKQGGAWIPDATRPSNWKSLSPEAQASIRAQQEAHMTARFRFIHYNGISPSTLSYNAYHDMKQNKNMFDDSVVIIDEIHNLVRTINGTKVGSKDMTDFIRQKEPHAPMWNMETSAYVDGKYRYPRGYTLYRLLQNAVNTKILALSATPMVNYAQEFAILMNIIGGEKRTVEIALPSGYNVKAIFDWAMRHPSIDYVKIENKFKTSKQVLTITPVPHGFSKVVNETGFIGFVKKSDVSPSTSSNERNMETWRDKIFEEMTTTGIIPASTKSESYINAYPLLFDDGKNFVTSFIDEATLNIKNEGILLARAKGLISYYRGGSEELMPRSETEIVRVPMSDNMYAGYASLRYKEIEDELKKKGKGDGAATSVPVGATAGEIDLYKQATKTPDTGFKTLSRAACNWVWPDGVPRPSTNLKDRMKELGVDEKQKEEIIAVDKEVDITENVPVPVAVAAGGAVVDDDTQVDAPPVDTVVETVEPATLSTVNTLMVGLEGKPEDAERYLRVNLAEYSTKYLEIYNRIRNAPRSGPALVYSQFKTLEGLGIFAAVLRASEERYLPLDIEEIDGSWQIPEALMALYAAGGYSQPRYVLYTGDQPLDKRRLLLQLYNSDVSGLPPKLAEQCALLMRETPVSSETRHPEDTGDIIDNRYSSIARVFMITQSGAEGISLFNTRQVHLMEPYWNNVRIEQVIGRAIRLCSHMNLPWDDRMVNVYTYMSVFSEEQLSKMDATDKLRMFDSSKTTDEAIFDIAVAKSTLSGNLFKIAQSAAVDCRIHEIEHSIGAAMEKIKCYDYPSDAPFAYNPDLRKDVMLKAGLDVETY